MIAFAELLERLTLTPGRLAKIALLRRFFETEPDPDRGFGLAALTGELAFQAAKPALIRGAGRSAHRSGAVRLVLRLRRRPGRDGGADVAGARPNAPPPCVTDVVQALRARPKAELPALVAGWLDASAASVRYALLKLITGALRVGASARLAKIALAELAAGTHRRRRHRGGLARADAALRRRCSPGWRARAAPGPGRRAGVPPADAGAPAGGAGSRRARLRAFAAEWKWDGIRVQLVAHAGGRRLYSRGADDISGAFPEIVEAHGVRRGAGRRAAGGAGRRGGAVRRPAAAAEPQAPSAKMLREFPVLVRLYDILFDGAEDLRALPFTERRARLEAWFAGRSRRGWTCRS